MKKNPKLEVLPPTNHPSWMETLEEQPLVQWAVANGKTLLYILVGLILLSILFFRLIMSSSSASKADFINAEREYVIFAAPAQTESDPTLQMNALKSLSNTMDAHPELHAKYDGRIAETLLIRGQNVQAINYATSAIKRTSQENAPFYTAYAQTTVTIANNQYEQALNESNLLKDQMQKQGQELQMTPEKMEFSTLLYALNLLRIGMLQQKLALSADEGKTWQEWKGLVSKSQTGALPRYLDGQLFLLFDRLLSEGDASFANYIDFRMKEIQSN